MITRARRSTDALRDFRSAIESAFGMQMYARPLFYSYPNGLRFGLSEGDTAIGQLLVAIHKATRICKDVFDGEDSITVWLSVTGEMERSAIRTMLAELHSASIRIPRHRSLWLDTQSVPDDDAPSVNVAFEAPATMLPNFLWCALASDLPEIRPRPRCLVHLINMESRLLLFPYDDRGMDVVGPNPDLLAQLYVTHNQDLLDQDRGAMKATFSQQG